MPLDFPNSPTNGQTFGSYIYDTSIPGWRNVNSSEGIGLQFKSGLVPIVPTSVNVGSGSATVNANGEVSFSGATSISLNGVFTESYTRYKINFVGRVAVGTAGVDFYAKFRRNNSDISAGYYGSAIYNAYNASLTNSAQFTNTAYGFIGYIGNLEGSLSTIEIATSSTFSGWSMHCRNTSAASQHIGGFNTTTSSGVDGFTIYPASSTMTGTFQVYGYN
jgi:hypothetical protein